LFVLQPKGKKSRNYSEKENKLDLHNLAHAPIDLLLGFLDNNKTLFQNHFTTLATGQGDLASQTKLVCFAHQRLLYLL